MVCYSACQRAVPLSAEKYASSSGLVPDAFRFPPDVRMGALNPRSENREILAVARRAIYQEDHSVHLERNSQTARHRHWAVFDQPCWKI